MIFAIIISITGSGTTMSILMMSLMSIMFVTIQSAFLMGREIPFLDITKTLPVKLISLINAKLVVCLILNAGVIALTLIVLSSIGFISWKGLVLFPFLILYYVTAALMGMKAIISNSPLKIDNPNSILRSGNTFGTQMLSTIIGVAGMAPVAIVLFNKIDLFFGSLLVLLAVALASAALFVSYKNYQQIKTRLRIV